MRSGTIGLALAVLAMTSVAASRSEAGFAAVEFNPGSGADITNPNSDNLGYRFQVTSPQTATALGYYDFLGNGFIEDHFVGLYTDGGLLLASANVTTTDALLGNFRYHAIAPTSLGVGTYRVAGVNVAEVYAFSVTGLTPAAGITYLNPAYSLFGTPSFPNLLGGGARDGYFGGTLMVEGGGSGSIATPLPPTLLAGFLGMALLAGVRRSRRA